MISKLFTTLTLWNSVKILNVKTVRKSTKMIILIAILLGLNSCYGTGGTPKNYASLDSYPKTLCSLDCVKAQFWCEWKQESFVSEWLLKYHFFRMLRLLFKSLHELAFAGFVVLPVLIDNCIVFLVNVYVLFCKCGTDINKL